MKITKNKLLSTYYSDPVERFTFLCLGLCCLAAAAAGVFAGFGDFVAVFGDFGDFCCFSLSENDKM